MGVTRQLLLKPVCRTLLLPLFLAAAVAVSAQQTQSTTPYTIPVTVRRVVLDVVVLNKANHRVTGLKRRDFSVFEDNQSQPIRTFEELDLDSPLPSYPQLPPLPPNTFTDIPGEPERGPLYVIVLDLLHLFHGDITHYHFEDQIWARQELSAFLASKPPGTRFALFVLAQDFRMVQGFTTDPALLLRAFDVDRAAPHVPWAFLYAESYGAADPAVSYEVLAFIGRFLDGLPGRKNLIWVARAFPMSLPMFGLSNTQGGTKDLGGGYHPAQGTMGSGYTEKVMREAIDALDQAQVSVYPIDTAMLYDRNADIIAHATGGRIYEGNGFRANLLDATENGASYYEISYAPDHPDYDGRMRNIRIELAHEQEGDSLEYRTQYFADDPYAPLTHEEQTAAARVLGQMVAHHPGDSLFAYMQHGAPNAHDILFRAHFTAGPDAPATPAQMAALVDQPAYFDLRRRKGPDPPLSPVPLSTYTIDYLVLDRLAGVNEGQVLEFAAAAYTSLGKMLNGISQYGARTQTAASHPSEKFFRASQTLDVPANAAWIRIAVGDTHSDRIGTIEISLPLQRTADPVSRSGTLP